MCVRVFAYVGCSSVAGDRGRSENSGAGDHSASKEDHRGDRAQRRDGDGGTHQAKANQT